MNDNKKAAKKSAWKWWQKKNSDNNINIMEHQEEVASIAQSSLIVQHSVYSEDITSTASIKSKPWAPTIDNEDTSTIVNHVESNVKSSTLRASNSSAVNPPSISSSTVPVYNFQPEPTRSDSILFSGIKVKLIVQLQTTK